MCTPPVDVPTAVLDPCGDGRVLLAFVSSRETGRPEATSLRFDVPEAGEVCIQVVSPAALGGVPAASAEVALDGASIRAPSDFRHAATEFTQRGTLTAGNHVIEIVHRSTPGSTIAVRVRFAGAGDAERIASETRAIEEAEFAACNELNRSLEALPPEGRERFVDAMTTLGLRPGQMVVEHNVWGSASHLAPLPSEGVVPPGATPSEAASDWVARHRALLGVEDGDIALEVTSSSALADGHRVQFGVSWRGLPVAGAGLTLVLDTDLETRAVTGEVPPRVAALATPVVTEAEAIAVAELAAGASAHGPASLQILDLAAIALEPRTVLVWLVPTGGGLVRVDAGDRTVLDISSGVFEYERVLVEDLVTTSGTAIIREDTTGRWLPASEVCTAAECVALHDFLDRTDFYFRHGMNRTGWSGDGNSILPADAPYTVLYNALEIVGAFTQQPFDPHGQFLTYDLVLNRADGTAVARDVDMRPLLVVSDPHLTESVVVHEMVHAAFEEILDRGPLTYIRPCELSRIHEHVADTAAMFEDGFYGRSIDAQLILERHPTEALPTAVTRDHRTLGAPVYPVGHDARSCADDAHLSRIRVVPPTTLSSDVGVCVPHRNSCVYTRLWALGREADEAGVRIPYHGVDGVGMQFTEGKHLFNDMFLGHLTEHDGTATYGTGYLEAAARRITACIADHSCPELFGGTSLEDGLVAPMLAVGLWTPAFDLLRRGSSVGPAVAARDGSVWVFHAPPGDDTVFVVEYADILDGSRGLARPLSDLGVPLPTTRSDLAATRSLDLVTLAVIPFGGERVVVASTVSGVDPTWRSDLLEVSVPGVHEGTGALAVIHATVPVFPPASTAVLVAGRASSGTQQLVAFTGRAPAAVVIPDSSEEGSPALTPGDTSGTVLLWSIGFRVAGSAAVIGAPRVLLRRVGIVAATGEVTWTPREVVDDVDSIPGDGLVAGSFLGRMQFLLSSEVRPRPDSSRGGWPTTRSPAATSGSRTSRGTGGRRCSRSLRRTASAGR